MKKILLMLPLIWACKQELLPPQVPVSDTQSVAGAAAGSTVSSGTISFGGYTWTVKDGAGLGPGPNTWSAANVWVDASGFMHLKLSYDSAAGKWNCAGVTSTQSLGYGTYQWKIQGPVSTLDKMWLQAFFITPDRMGLMRWM